MQLLIPAPRVGSYRGAKQLLPSGQLPNRWGSSTATCASPCATGRCPGWGSACAHHMPRAGITLESPPGRIQAGQGSGAALLSRVHWFLGFSNFSCSLMTSMTTRAGTRCILGHLKTMWWPQLLGHPVQWQRLAHAAVHPKSSQTPHLPPCPSVHGQSDLPAPSSNFCQRQAGTRAILSCTKTHLYSNPTN